MNTCGFVHLHTHTMYSLLDGAIRTKDLIRKAIEWNMGAAAVTDHGNMFGAVEFFIEASKVDLKPIIGSEIYVSPGAMTAREASRGGTDISFHLVLLAETDRGYRNLMKIVSAGYLEGFYYKPRVDKAYLREHAEGLIALSACLKGEVATLVARQQIKEARAAALEYRDLFGEGNFFLEIQRHGIELEDRVYAGIRDIAKETGIPLVATNDAHYLKQEHASSHEVLLCISTGKTMDDASRMRMETNQFYLKTPDEMKALFADVPEALENTVRIAERCQVNIDTGQFHTVKFTVPEGFSGTTDEYLAHIAEIGLVKRYGEQADSYRERMAYELDIINRMGFSDYFLAIYDCTRYAGEQGIPVGTARGSAGGSIVAYAIGITNLDPMKYGLIFERFLNPERVSMPDFDVDYADRDRAKMIEYVKRTYGEDHVCQIITFGTMKAKMVIRDVGRVLGMPYGEVDVIAKLIPNDLGTTLESAFELVPELRELEKTNEKCRELFAHARVLEGLNRHAGTHAAGVVITPGPCSDYLPLYRQGEDITTQYTMEFVEKIGCLKVDFLGLRTLTVIKDAVDLARAGGHEIDIDAIPMDDPAVYDLMSRGDTIGVFQFESGGMRDYLRKLRPTSIEDLIAMNALYRPGPLGSNMVDDFIGRKQGRKKMEYPHPLLEGILKETYGVIVYQEQVMKIANVLAGFSLGAADELRRAMGKKKIEVMTRMRHQFLEGAQARDIPEKTASEIFELMAHFAGYGFNKSHSAGYAILAYQTAWLKAHYPSEFMAAALTSEMDTTERIVILIEECRNMGISALPPHVNHSRAEFTVEEGNVRFGLGGIKNVGLNAIDAVTRARESGGPFTDLFDFCARVDMKSLNRRVIESLVMAGALDLAGASRSRLFAAVANAADYAQNSQRERELGQFNMFGGSAVESAMTPSLPAVKDWTWMETLINEKSVLGFWFSGHPLEKYEEELKAFTVPLSQLSGKPDRAPVAVGGIITQVTRKTRKKDDKPFINIKLEDMGGSCPVIFLNGAFDQYKDRLAVDSMVIIEGTVKNDGSDTPSVFAAALEPLEEARGKRTKAITIALSTTESNDAGLKQIAGILEIFPGSLPVWIDLRTGTSGKYRVKAAKYQVSSDPALVRDLKKLLGNDKVWIS